MRMRRAAALAMSALLVTGLAACGGDDDDDNEDSGLEAVEEATDGQSGDDNADDSSDDSSDDSGDDGDDSGDDTEIDDVPGLSEECEVFANAAIAFGNAFSGTGDVDFGELADGLDEFADAAPDAIAEDVQVLADAYQQFAEAIGDDVDLSDPSSFSDPEVAQRIADASEVFNSQEFQDATTAITDFTAANCANG